MKDNIRIFSLFLPQFHECEYNNKWWGKNFTEWNVVKKASPLFVGHNQPRIPLDGYYDLSNIESIEGQFDLASKYGIDGFVFYHYWYQGIRPLSKPLDLVMQNRDANISYSLCWANHSWTRSWTNRVGSLDVLIEQTYEVDEEKKIEHFTFLNRCFTDPRYIKIDGKPLFQIYVPDAIPDLENFINELREFTMFHSKVELHISAIVTTWKYNWSYLSHFNSVSLSQPVLAINAPNDIFSDKIPFFEKKSLNSHIKALPKPILSRLYRLQDKFFNRFQQYDYDQIWKNVLIQYENALKFDKPILPYGFVDFDNTPRYGKRAKIMTGFDPETFGTYLKELIKVTKPYNNEKIIFLNAWNEWGEGMYLQGDEKFKNQRLEQVLKAKNGN